MSDHTEIPPSSLLAPVLCAAFLAAAACGGSTGPGNGDDSETPGPATGTEIEMVSPDRFRPEVDTVSVGDTVTWTNRTSSVHTVTADDDSWDSGDVDPEGSFQRVFDRTGEHPYHCLYHGSPGSGMHGTIVVEQ